MFELQGKYASAKVFASVVENESISQVLDLLNQPYAKDSTIRMMPDIHAGAGCTIGTTMTIKDKVCPNLVGVDIGCGMEVAKIQEKDLDLPKLDALIRNEIPSGFEIRREPYPFSDKVHLSELLCRNSVDIDRAICSVGTLGGGNHFIEVDRDDNGNLYIVIHSGSRHLGLEVVKHYQEAAFKALSGPAPEDVRRVIDALKVAGRQQEINDIIKAIKAAKPSVPKALAYVEGELLESYLHDMDIAQSFARENRKAMMNIIVRGMGVHVDEEFSTIHNYIDMSCKILRKGAVSALKDERLLIPMNMRDGSLICIGKGNPDWNYSAPHGAGRLMSRSEAKGTFTVEEFEKQMSDVYTTSVGQSTLDECPMAYKNMEDIVGNIAPTVDIVEVIKPIYNFKAGN